MAKQISLLNKLGLEDDARRLIITSIGLGCSRSMNEGVYRSLRQGVATSATLLMPCPWARDAAVQFSEDDLGLSLTLNSEFDNYRWGPITYAPSLLDGDGGFPRTITDVWDHADLEETRRECKAQIDRAILWGFEITHLGTHLDAMTLRPEFFDIYLELACDYELPIRLPPASAIAKIGFPIKSLAEAEGILSPDNVLRLSEGTKKRAQSFEQLLENLPPGVTEIQLQPAEDSRELRAITPNWPLRVEDLQLATNNDEVKARLESSGVELIGYSALRDLQRSA